MTPEPSQWREGLGHDWTLMSNYWFLKTKVSVALLRREEPLRPPALRPGSSSPLPYPVCPSMSLRSSLTSTPGPLPSTSPPVADAR